jgi:hypothetical protein
MSHKGNGWDKQVKKLLLNPQGRAALKKFGIEVEIAKNNHNEDTPTVVILMPTYRAPEPQTQDALSAMVKHTRESGNVIVYGGAPMQASVVHWSRNMLIGEHLKSGKPWTHALFIDDDMVVAPDALLKLLSHKKDIIGGLCTRRADPPVPTIRFYDEVTGNLEQIWEWPERQLIEVGGIGTGFLLVSKHALEQVAQAYFDCLWEKDFYQVSDEWVAIQRERRLAHFDKTRIAFWFRFLPAKAMAIEQGEDMSFCLMARKYCGIPIFCDTTVQPGHIGNYDFGIKDFLMYRDVCIARAKEAGTYKDEAQIKSGEPIHSFRMTYEDVRV